MGKNTKMELSIVIVSFNTSDFLRGCLKSIKRHSKAIDYEIIVVDNASSDDSVEVSKYFGAKVIANKKNLGFAAANNQGIKVAKGEFVLFLNSDTFIKDNVLGEMVSFLKKNPKIGVTSCRLKNSDGSTQATGGYFPDLLRVFSWMTIQDFPFVDKVILPFHPLHSKSTFARGEEFYKTKKNLDWVTGAFLLARKDVLSKVGGWDETYFMYVEEVDLCFKIKRLGYSVWYDPKWSIVHFGGKSSTSAEFPLISEYKGICKFYRKFYPSWQYPIVKLFLKIGAVGRIVLFAILGRGEESKIYAKAFKAI